MRVIRMCVGCQTGNGPDLMFVKVECSQEQYEQGEHYQFAVGWVEENTDGTPCWACDENDPGKAVIQLCDNWDAVPVSKKEVC